MAHAGTGNGDARPTRIGGGYEVVQTFGPTAAGVVYGVRRAGLDTPLALTILGADIAADRERLGRVEAAVRDVAALAHEHIARVVELGREADPPHLVEAVLGTPLERVLRDGGALPTRDVLEVACQLAAALAHVHDAGLVHGALTPSTVWIGPDRPRRALLSGFASAAGGAVVLRYLAPERLARGVVDARGDVFALGLVLFEMLEGRPLLDGGDDEVRRRLVDDAAPLVPRFSRITPSGIPGLVARMIRRNPAERPRASALRDELARCLERVPAARLDPASRKRVVVDEGVLERADDDGEPAGPRLPAPRPGFVRPRRPWRGGLGAEWALLAAVVVALVWLATRGGRATPPEAADPVPEESAAVAREEPPAAPAEAERAIPTVAPVEHAAPAADPGAASAAPRNRPPRIVGRHPRATGPLVVTEGRALEFGVRAEDPDADDVISYAWRLDGRSAGGGSRFRFVAPPAASATAHTVEVSAIDRAGARTRPTIWRIAVAPRMSETNVRDWLERLASAWQRGDVATLRLYGIVTSAADADAEALGKSLRRVKDRRVVIANERIRTSGRYAVVAFDRTELDTKGKAVTTVHESFELEKRADGFVALRHPAGTSLAGG